MIRIREEQQQDREAIREVYTRAFGQSQEADIVDRLRQNCGDLISFVALEENRLVGHILFSPVTIEDEERTVRGVGLAPMAVLLKFQRKGIGSELVRAGIERLKNMDCPFVIVVGFPEYYPRFGFESASRYDIKSEWDVPDEAFMILVLNESELGGISGVVKYQPEFAECDPLEDGR